MVTLQGEVHQLRQDSKSAHEHSHDRIGNVETQVQNLAVYVDTKLQEHVVRPDGITEDEVKTLVAKEVAEHL